MGCDDPLAERDADGVAAGLAGLDDDPRHLASPYRIRQRTYENPDPHRQWRTAASPPDRPRRSRRDGPPSERRYMNPADPTAPTTARSQANFATAPRLPGGRGMREASRALGPMSAGVLIKLPRHPAPPPSTFGGACAYLLMQRAKRQNHPAARRFPSFPYRAVPININPPHGVSPTFEPDEICPESVWSSGEPAAGFLHGRQRALRPRERAGAHVDAGGFGGDRDLLAGRGVAALALLLRGLDAHGDLHEPADLDLLRVAELVEADGFERVEDALGVGLGELRAVGDGGEQLRLGQRHGVPLLESRVSDHRTIFKREDRTGWS